jgi:regulator of replication initiation timing
MTSIEDELRRCKREIDRLIEENGALRVSSESFGALAERLNQALAVERRSRKHGNPGTQKPGRK